VYFLHILAFFISLAFASEGTVTYEKFYRLNTPLNRSNSGDWIGLSYYDSPPKSPWDTFVMGDLRFYFQDNNSLNYSLQEAYIRYNSDSYKLTVGRQILDWNQNEKYWGLGYLNANQAFTLLSDKEEGVTGIILNKVFDPFEIDLLLSYLFIPQINPSLQIKNGVASSRSEWMRLPPKYAKIGGNLEPIYYKITPYSVSKILLNKSIGGNIKYKWDKESGVSAFAVYKPENRLRSNAIAYYDNVVLKQTVVEAAPTVNHHAYYGVEIYHAFGDVKGRGGISYVDPNARLGKDFPVPITNGRQSQSYQVTGVVINPKYEREAYSHLSVNLDRKVYALSLNYIHILTRVTRTNDDFTSDAVKWKRAFGGSISYNVLDNLNLFLDMKYDLARFDNIVKAEVKYNYRNKILLAFGLEMLKAPQDSSYWSYYRADDTVYSSVGFYF